MMAEFSKEQRRDAILSIQQYFERNMPESLGDLAAGLLLDFFLQDIGPVIYNKAVEDAQARIQLRIAEVDGELYEAPFTYWQTFGKRSR